MPTIVTTSVSVTKLIDIVPNTIAESVVNSVLTGANISRNLIADMNYGFNRNMQKYLIYGQSTYTNGLPLTAITHGTNADDIALFTAFIPSAIGVLVSRLGNPDPFHVVAHFLHTNPEWIMYPSTIPVAIIGNNTGNFSRTATCQNVATGNTYYISIKEDLYSHIGTNVQIKLQPSNGGTYAEFIIDFPVNYLPGTTVYGITYEVPADGFGLTRNFQHWIYDPMTGAIPELNSSASATSLTTSYPIVPLRLDNQNIVDNPETVELAKTARQLLRLVNIDIDDVSEKIEENPDIAELDDAYLMFAADLNSDTDAALTYLYQYFKEVYYNGPRFSQQNWLNNANNSNENIPEAANSRNYLQLRDNAVSIDIQFNFITVEVKNGDITGSLPTYDSAILVTESTLDNPVDVGNILGAVTKQIILGSEQNNANAQWYNDHVIIYRKQLTLVSSGDATDTYSELVIHGLQHNIKSVAKAGIVHRSLADMVDGGFFIPLSHDVIKLLNGVDEIEIYQESLSFVVYAIQVIHLSWYEDPAFWEFVGFIILVISLYSGSAELGEAISAGLYATFVYIAEAYLYSVVIGEVLTLLIKEIGGDVALILAAIASVYAIYKGGDSRIFLDLLDANQLLSLATLTVGAVNVNTAEQLADLQEEMLLFETEAEALQEEIDAAEELLNYGTHISLYTLTTPTVYTNFNESPTDFLNRSIHLTNPGVLALDMIEGYVDMALTLPKLT